jgi:MoaA/NifB/PqqE/SkfB family radical SAM enzyme
MNDGASTFIFPKPRVSPVRAAARWGRRQLLIRRRGAASGEHRKRFNSELNWREFWHGRTVLDSYPRVVQVGTNWTCNLKCSFCRLTMPWTQEHLHSLPARQLAISDKVESILARLLPFAEMVTLTPLGEPFLWGGLDPLLELHERLGSRNLTMTTNGMLMTDKNCERVVRAQLPKLFFSIDSNDPEIYAGMRVGGDLRVVEEGLARLNAWKEKLHSPWPALVLNGTFMERNAHQLPSMVEWAKRLGFEEFSVQLMEIENPDHEPEFLGHHVDLAHRALKAASAEARRVGLRFTPHLALKNLISSAAEGRDVEKHEYKAASPRLPEEKKNGKVTDVHGFNGTGLDAGATLDPEIDMRGKTLVEKCSYPWYFLLIDTDGDVRPCCWAATSWLNLNDLDFDEVWNGEAAQTMRRRFLNNDIPVSCMKKHCRVDL